MAKSLAVRVDDRLIHGQVVTQWVKVFKAQKIVVIDNNVAKDKMQKNVLKFAAPPEIKVSIFSVDKAVEIWEKNQFGNLNVFVLFKDVKQIKELADKGVKFDEITLGNMSIIGDRKQIYKSTGFTEEESVPEEKTEQKTEASGRQLLMIIPTLLEVCIMAFAAIFVFCKKRR